MLDDHIYTTYEAGLVAEGGPFLRLAWVGVLILSLNFSCPDGRAERSLDFTTQRRVRSRPGNGMWGQMQAGEVVRWGRGLSETSPATEFHCGNLSRNPSEMCVLSHHTIGWGAASMRRPADLHQEEERSNGALFGEEGTAAIVEAHSSASWGWRINGDTTVTTRRRRDAEREAFLAKAQGQLLRRTRLTMSTYNMLN